MLAEKLFSKIFLMGPYLARTTLKPHFICMIKFTCMIAHKSVLLDNNIEQEKAQDCSMIYKIIKNKLHLKEELKEHLP